MELRRYLAILRRRLLLIVVTMAVAAAAAWAATPKDAKYTAKATIYVGIRQFTIAQNNNTVSNDVLLGVERISTTFAVMIRSQPIALAAAERTHVSRSTSKIVAETNPVVVTGTQLLSVYVTDSDPSTLRRVVIATSAPGGERRSRPTEREPSWRSRGVPRNAKARVAPYPALRTSAW